MLHRLFAPVFAVCIVAPALSAPSLAAPASAPPTYRVVAGDTLWTIAARTHTSVAALTRLNHLANANVLQLGEVLSLGVAVRSASGKRTANRVEALFGRGHLARTRPGHFARIATARGRAEERAGVRMGRPTRGARIAESAALWEATHNGGSSPNPIVARSMAVLQHMVMQELGLTRTALRYLGVPYVWGGESLAGVDCSGFVQAVFRHNGIELPRTADAQFAVGRRIPQNALLPGDLVFFETYSAGASHVGIYLGAGRFVHASASDGVRIDSLLDDYYAARYLGARREAI